MPYNPPARPPIAGELISVSITKPGFLGLNTQASGIDMNPGWSTEGENVVINDDGAVASRKGWTKVNTTSIATTTPIEAMHEYISASASTEIISCANNKIYRGETTLIDITPVSPTWSGNLWKIQNFTNHAYFFQAGQPPLRFDGSVVLGLTAVPGFVDSSDAVIGTLKPNECLAAFGRLWVADASTDKMKIWWCDSLLGNTWSGGSSGSLDLRSVLSGGMDQIVGLRAWNNFLIIFFRKHIIIYQNPETPQAITLWDTIDGIGCIARDSIQEIGTDILFLSDGGVKSLQRTIQEKSLPVSDVSKNVRDFLIKNFPSTDFSKVKSVYHEADSFYLVTLPKSDYSYVPVFCFDVRRPLDDGSYRVTYWNGNRPKAFLSTRSRVLYLGQSGHIGKYEGYSDNGVGYHFCYISAWLALEVPNLRKILKRIHSIVEITKNDTLTFEWSYDYSGQEFKESVMGQADTIYEYGIAEYGIAEYSSGKAIDDLQVPGAGSGEVVRFGISKNINGFGVVLHKIDAMFKLGRSL